MGYLSAQLDPAYPLLFPHLRARLQSKVWSVPLAATACDQHVSYLCRVRLIVHQGPTVSEEREDAQEGGFGPPAVRGSKG